MVNRDLLKMRKAMPVVINAPRHSPPNSTPIIRPTSELLTSRYSIYQKQE